MSEERFEWRHITRGIFHLWDKQSHGGAGGYVASIYKEGRRTWHYRIFDTGDSDTVTSVAKYKAQRLVEVLVRMS